MTEQAETDIATKPNKGTPAAGAPPERSTHFVFTHKVFSAEGAFFGISPMTDEPVFNVSMGELNASLTLPTLAREFKLTPDTEDGRLLGIIAKSLRFVKQIRPGDSIPRELLDGSSSWTVEPHHQEIARARLSVYLLAWVSGEDPTNKEVELLQKLARDPDTQLRVNKALGDMAEKLGHGRENKERVLDLMDTVARELAYIEALRERHDKLKAMDRKIVEASKLYRRERNVAADIQRVQVLLKAPLAEFPGIFLMAEWQTAEMTALLSQVPQRIASIRNIRDDLHVRFMKWDEMIRLWDEIPAERGEAMEVALRTTYRFLAKNFPLRSDWTLTTKG